MSLLTSKEKFKADLAKEFDSFFIREYSDPPNKYFVNPLRTDGTNKTYEELIHEIKEKNLDFSNTIANLIHNFIISGEVSFLPNTVLGTCPPGGGPLTLGQADKGIIK